MQVITKSWQSWCTGSGEGVSVGGIKERKRFRCSHPSLLSLPQSPTLQVMAPIRISTASQQRRRRSSLAPFIPAKAGIYGINRPVTFAPNVTPGTFAEPEDYPETTFPQPPSPSSALFPPSELPTASSTRRRAPPGKRRSQGYIPRPPNAFMLFRADFVRQKHVPGSIETNHGSLSKIIGNCWRALPLEEKRVWEVKAKHAKAEHKARYPNYRFRPVHKNKEKDRKKEKPPSTMEDERRCEEVAQLLLEGKKGDELAAAMRDLERARSNTQTPSNPEYYLQQHMQQGQHLYQHRRSSSVPLPNDYYPNFYSTHTYNGGGGNGNGFSGGTTDIALPLLPFFTTSRPSSPVSISRQQRVMLGHRRSSSAGPFISNRSWTMPTSLSMPPVSQHMFQQDNTPLPEVDASLFNPSWSNAFPTSATTPNNATSVGVDGLESSQSPFSFNDIMSGLGPSQSPHDQGVVGPLDPAPLHLGAGEVVDGWMSLGLGPLDSHLESQVEQVEQVGSSKGSTAYSGSPEPSESGQSVLHAPRPQQPSQIPMSMGEVEAGMEMLMYHHAENGAWVDAHSQAHSHSQPSSFDALMGMGDEHGFDLDYGQLQLCGGGGPTLNVDASWGNGF
ncbi:hypothetical protein AX17_002010 [Amanita inopinata Kibby_2008]|nr:hypothetical protein AX17_002010 [Amanita inopinata Kibby_2008]